MPWFLSAILCVLGWGCADLFYKKGTDEDDSFSHLKIAVWVGFVMGITSLFLIPASESLKASDAGIISGIVINAAKYAPASFCYIISMVIGYAGLRYLELSIISPIQNASGAFATVFMMVFFIAKGRYGDVTDAFSTLDIIGTVLIITGLIYIAFVENRISLKEKSLEEKRRYTGALALLFPVLYCIFDTLGTAADGIILDEETGLGLGEIDVIIVYGITFFIAGLIAWIILWIKGKRPYNLFAVSERPKACAAGFEMLGQLFYVFAMAGRPVVAAPMVASYCIVSVILARFFAKEKLRKAQYACIFCVIAGIVLLGISEGLNA